MTGRRRPHPVHGLPFEPGIANTLEAEYRRLGLGARLAAWRKVVQREAFARWMGQSRLRVERAPATARRVLWIYDWGALGDSLMDLAVRRHLPSEVAVDLLVSPALRPLYDGDPFWRRVHDRVEECEADPDFVLLQHFNARSLRLKTKVAPAAPYGSVFGHLQGEHFDRMDYAQRRIEQLFGVARRDAAAQHLTVQRAPCRTPGRWRVAVALGARDPRRSGPRWAPLLDLVVARWPAQLPRPLFVLMGDASARGDLATFEPGFIARHCEVDIDRRDLREVAASMATCDAFVGMDGGLMHVAVALGKPGLAIFRGIDPAMRLRPTAAMRPLVARGPAADIDPPVIATALLAALVEATRCGRRAPAEACDEASAP